MSEGKKKHKWIKKAEKAEEVVSKSKSKDNFKRPTVKSMMNKMHGTKE